MTTKKISMVFSITFAAFLTISCGGSDTAGPLLTGNLVDSPVAGVGYATPTVTGVTTLDGEFSYRDGEAIVFSVGKLALPVVQASDMITPLDIADSDDVSDAAVINVARLLQSLDEDADPSNGIFISESTKSAFDETLNFDVADDNAVGTVVDRAFSRKREPVTALAAKSHFIETLSENANSVASLRQLQYLVPVNEVYSGDSLSINGQNYELTRAGVTNTGITDLQNGVYQLIGIEETLFVSVSDDDDIKLTCIAKSPKPVADCTDGVYRIFEEELLAMEFNSNPLVSGEVVSQPSNVGITDTLNIGATTDLMNPDSDLINVDSSTVHEIEETEVSVSTDSDVDIGVSLPAAPVPVVPVEVAERTPLIDSEGEVPAQQTQTDNDVLVRLKFDNGTSLSSATDSSGNGNDGVINGASYVANSVDGSPSSLYFDGVDDGVSLGGLDVSGTGLTLSAWINADTFPGSNRDPRIISKATSTATDDHVFMLGTIKLGSETVLRGRLRIEGITHTLIADAGTSLVKGVWYHSAMIYDGSAMKLYLNGQEVGTKELVGTIDQDSDIEVSIGENPGGGRNWDGLLDDVRILQRPYSVSELVEIIEETPESAIAELPPQKVEVPSVGETNSEGTSTSETSDGQLITIEVDTAPINSATGCATEGSANETISVLLIGNSLMRNVQSKLEQLLTCGGYSTNLATSNPGGSWLHEHLKNERTLDLIAEGYDLTLLQEKSRGISTHNPPFSVLNDLKDKIEAAGSRMGFYQTWGFSNRNPEVTEPILSRYEYIADQFNAPLMHIGRAWDYFYTSNNETPPFSLFTDTVHATDQGQTLIAYVLYAYLTDDSPVNLSSLTLPDHEAFELQTIAWETYQSNI